MQVDTGQFAALTEQAEAAYHAGFGDGQDRLRDELGVPAVPRIRSAPERIVAENVALTEAAVRAVWHNGYRHGTEDVLGTAPGRHATPRGARTGRLRLVGGDGAA